jgi:hypothetical protein
MPPSGAVKFLAANRPRVPRPRGAYSAIKVAAPPYSPPVEKPWIILRTTISTGAHNPIAE